MAMRQLQTTALASARLAASSALLLAVAAIHGAGVAQTTVDQAMEPLGLPQLEHLTFDSDYSAFIDPDVPAEVRLRALRKLWSRPGFNEIDRLSVYLEPYPLQPLEELADGERQSGKLISSR